MTGAASPISVTLGGVYHWKIDPDFLDECITKCLSDGILSQFDESFFENAEVCYHRRRSELWFHDRSRRDGELFLYDLDREMWYCYSGVSVERLFVYNGGVGFFEGGKICLFDEALATDSYVDKECEIKAVFESGYLDFGGVETDKRLENAVLVAELCGGGLSVCVNDGRVLSLVKLSEADAAAPTIYEPRMPTGRFRMAKLTLCADGPFRQRIYRAELFAQKGKK